MQISWLSRCVAFFWCVLIFTNGRRSFSSDEVTFQQVLLGDIHTSLTTSLSLQGRWGQEGESATGRPAALTAVRWCAAAEATTRPESATPSSASASSTGAAPSDAATATSRWTCTPVRARRDLVDTNYWDWNRRSHWSSKPPPSCWATDLFWQSKGCPESTCTAKLICVASLPAHQTVGLSSALPLF